MVRATVRGTTGAKGLLRSLGYPNIDTKDAVEQGILAAEKIGSNWAYAADSADFEFARESMAQSVDSVCRDWLITPMPVMVNTARKRDERTDIEFSIARALIRESVKTGGLGSLPMLTADYVPYFSVYSFDDQAEVDRQIDTVRRWTLTGGKFRGNDLLVPQKLRNGQAWRDCVLAHAEFLGFGSWEGGWFLANRVPH